MRRRDSIFLCHSSHDKAFVRLLASRLKTYGIKVWLDEAELRVGDSLIERIGSALDSVDYVAAVLSPHSIDSEWVKRELRVALDREFREREVIVLPILLTKVAMPPFLRDKVYVDFSVPDKFEESFGSLLRALDLSHEHLVHLQNQNFTFHKLHHFLTVHDIQGHLASWRKETTVTPLHPGIDLWRDEQFHTTGKIRFVSSKPGIIDAIKRDGGNLSVITRFDAPLQPGIAVTRILEIEVTDGCRESEEDFSWILMGSFEEFGIHLSVPSARPFKERPQIFYMLSTQECEIPMISVSEDRTVADFVVHPPIQGAKYVLRWKW